MTVSDPAIPRQVAQLYTGHHRLALLLAAQPPGLPGAGGGPHPRDLLRVLSTGAGAIRLREPRACLATIARGRAVDLWPRRDLERAYREALQRGLQAAGQRPQRPQRPSTGSAASAGRPQPPPAGRIDWSPCYGLVDLGLYWDTGLPGGQALRLALNEDLLRPQPFCRWKHLLWGNERRAALNAPLRF
ncbi:hypothetical protein GPA19_01535 [Azoarcus indigens]|uniref:hypothetical protein n=1 Tax=Azoarcus indigens TaxID=29545 RepID=UPI00106137C6|nr:hypothetical protein [Azoarcus indigens]NMG63634.1 hypothetical protein [Azoarcus indigens]